MNSVIPSPNFVERFTALTSSPVYTGQETEGVVEGLNFYTKTKQDAGIKVLEDVNLSSRPDPISDVLKALKRFSDAYNRGLPYGTPIQCGKMVATIHSAEAQVYQKVFPIAEKFLAMNLQTFLPDGISPLEKERVIAIYDAAYRFVHGFSKSTEENAADKGYLDCTVNEKRAVIVRRWM